MEIENVSECIIQNDIIYLSEDETDIESESDIQNESENTDHMMTTIESDSESDSDIGLTDENELKRENLYVEKDGIVIILDDENSTTGSTTANQGNQKEISSRIEVERNIASTSKVTTSTLITELINLDDKAAFVENTEVFECPVCYDKIKLGHGVILKECLHLICKVCLEKLVQFSEESFVRCPHLDEMQQGCIGVIQEREIRALVAKNVYEKFLEKSIRIAENTMQDSFHCKTPDCQGWCTYEPFTKIFECPVCQAVNCLKCHAIHSENKQTQRLIEESNATEKVIKAQLEAREIMYCPTCQALIEKITGCDGVICTICKAEVCWATRGPRWGPKGKGDTSGGCRCGINGKLCHPKCKGCH